MARDRPTIAAPPSFFPVKFENNDDNSAVTRRLGSTKPVAWPANGDALDSARVSASNGSGPSSAAGLPVAWELKTDREQYIESLESKMKRIAQPSNLGTSKPDSGYGGSHTSPQAGLEQLRSIHDDHLDDIDIEEPALAIPEHVDEVDEDEEEEDDNDETREGRALLSHAVRPAVTQGLGTVTNHHKPSSAEASAIEKTPGHSPHKSEMIVVVPPTPSQDDDCATDVGKAVSSAAQSDDEEDEAETTPLEFNRRPSILANVLPTTNAADDPDEQSRRISFSSSVRISGGIKSATRKPRTPARAALPTDLFSPVATTSITADDVARLGYMAHPLPRNASLSHSRNSSRANSPSRQGGVAILRTVSSSSSLGIHGGQGALAGPSSIYSSSVPSRSSSPCSSIYAPLKRPSETCPSPMSVKPPPKKPRSPKRTASGLSFREFLRSNGLSNGEADRTEDGEDEESVADRGYRELVEQQRRRKKRFDRTRRRFDASARGNGTAEMVEERGFWGRVMDLMSVSGKSGVGRGAAGGLIGPSTMTRDYGTNGTPGPKRVRRKRSSLSITSSVERDNDTSGEDEDDAEEMLGGRRRRSTGVERVKSEVEVRFGAAPWRWINPEWMLWRLRTIRTKCLGVRKKMRLRVATGSAIDTSDEESDSPTAQRSGRSSRRAYQRV